MRLALVSVILIYLSDELRDGRANNFQPLSVHDFERLAILSSRSANDFDHFSIEHLARADDLTGLQDST